MTTVTYRPAILLLLTLISLGLISGCDSVPTPPLLTPTGAALSWQDELALAQQEAAKLDSNPVLRWVQAGPLSAESEPSQVTFIFARPTVYITVKGWHTSPAISVSDAHGDSSLLRQQDIDHYARALSFVKVGPREIYEKTLAEGQAFAKDKPFDVHVSIYLNVDTQAELGVPAVWIVQYAVYDKSENGVFVGEIRELALKVNPQTGEIITRTSGSITDGTPSPTALTQPTIGP